MAEMAATATPTAAATAVAAVAEPIPGGRSGRTSRSSSPVSRGRSVSASLDSKRRAQPRPPPPPPPPRQTVSRSIQPRQLPVDNGADEEEEQQNTEEDDAEHSTLIENHRSYADNGDAVEIDLSRHSRRVSSQPQRRPIAVQHQPSGAARVELFFSQPHPHAPLLDVKSGDSSVANPAVIRSAAVPVVVATHQSNGVLCDCGCAKCTTQSAILKFCAGNKALMFMIFLFLLTIVFFIVVMNRIYTVGPIDKDAFISCKRFVAAVAPRCKLLNATELAMASDCTTEEVLWPVASTEYPLCAWINH